VKLAIAHLRSTSVYSQSKFYETEKERSETSAQYEVRTWRNRMHVDENGSVFIPPMAFKNCLSDAAKYLSMQIPGKGKSTYTKHFEAGVLVMDPLPLPYKAEQVKGEVLFVPSDGRRGGSNRVLKTFPLIPSWDGEVKFYILDEIVNPEVFREHLKWAGQIIGIGRFRPRNNGYYGRFKVEDVKWQEVDF
jgi:hypothetical protein